MDLMSVLREVNTWPVEDRVRLVHEVWDQLVEQGVDPESHEPSAKPSWIVDSPRMRPNPDDVVSWVDVKAAALKRRVSMTLHGCHAGAGPGRVRRGIRLV